MVIESRNPVTGELLASFEELLPEEVEKRLAISRAAFEAHHTTSFAHRAEKLRKVAAILEAECRTFAGLMTAEMGKTITASLAEVAKSARGCRFYADGGAAMLADEMVDSPTGRAFVRYQPIGPVLAVMPWNFPFWQVIRFAAPALMAGNVCLLKHASNVPQCALALEEIFRRAGFDQGEFQTLLIGSEATGPVIDDPRVRAVTLTGSTAAGRSVAARAGGAIKKTVLELGGSDPFIVTANCDFEKTVAAAVASRTVNNGQSCIAAKRFLVEDAIYERFTTSFVAALEKLRVGDPMDERTQLGPLATAAIRDEVEDQVRRAVDGGARLLTGGTRLPGPGNYFPPTAIDRIPPGNPARVEEIFGPVASIIRFHTLEEAITLANETAFGLGSSVWTLDEEEQRRFIDGIEAGMVFVNAIVASDPPLPFGGVKESGYGRELGSWGIREFVNVKAVWVDQAGGSR
ncbi:MAG: NAD-dependent succinate-semialdehyde dehydrogenase [Gemmatimonadota bacterium]|jgi:succinate-semialdehyde dehydrogenase/glutarate-semialdehyde dehydrogenase|nr:NAD-dependent succinate-semialdehyde dehydrogenase [Gemmatimonadota bacterium]